MSPVVANIAVVLATASTITFLVPQIVKLVRTGDSSGVSTTWAGLGFVLNVGWFTYLIARSLWASIFAPFSTFIAYGVTMWALGRTGRNLTIGYIGGSVAAVVLATIGLVGGWGVLGVVLGVSYGVVLAAPVITAYRTAVPSGVSALTWWIGLVEALLWGLYGWYHSDAGILTFTVVATIGSSLMLARYYATRRRAVPEGQVNRR